MANGVPHASQLEPSRDLASANRGTPTRGVNACRVRPETLTVASFLGTVSGSRSRPTGSRRNQSSVSRVGPPVVIESVERMNKASTKEPDDESDEDDHAAGQSARAQVAGVKNYITPSGLQRLKDEHRFLLTRERPAVTRVVTWAAGNGDRSENADYQYRQTAAARDRSAHSLSHETDRCCGNRGPGSPERWACGDTRLLRSDRALRQRLWNGAGGERRRPR